MVRTFVAALLAAVSISALPASASSCSLTAGEPVVLRSSDFDPDVLVWDSRQREIDYVSGNIKNTAEVLTHTVLSKSGTCRGDRVRPRQLEAALFDAGRGHDRDKDHVRAQSRALRMGLVGRRAQRGDRATAASIAHFEPFG